MTNAHHYFIYKINILFPQNTPIPRIEFIIKVHIDETLVTPMQYLKSCCFKSTSIIVYTNGNQNFFIEDHNIFFF